MSTVYRHIRLPLHDELLTIYLNTKRITLSLFKTIPLFLKIADLICLHCSISVHSKFELQYSNVCISEKAQWRLLLYIKFKEGGVTYGTLGAGPKP
jgi:hypothetical protein